MFSPIKNFITYIQKNASGNSIFGGNSTPEESTKMETEESVKPDNIKMETECESQDVKEDKEEEEQITSHKEDKDVEKETYETEEENTVEKDGKETCADDDVKSEHEQIKNIIMTTTSTVSADNSFEEEFEDYDYDIEAQIESSIMLKKPVKVAATNGREILEVKKSSNARSSIVISHDYNRHQALTPIDDELQDFRNDPTEILGTPNTDEFCSVDSAEEAKERDECIAEGFATEEEDDEDLKGEQETELAEGDGEESEREPDIDDKDIIEVEDDEEESYLDLQNYQSNDVIVLGDTDLNTSNASVDTVNTADDPLAIACEEQEAFAADKAAALEELNLLNTSQTSQDEDTTTTIDDDLQWLKTDLEGPQPSSSSSSQVLLIKERNGEGSDSGLGSETSTLHTTTTSITDTSQMNTTATAATPIHTPTQMKTKASEKMVASNLLQLATKSPAKDHPDKPFRSNLKRRLEIDDDVDGLVNITSSSSSSSALSDHSTLSGSLQKKPKRSINFDNVQVYYFPRQQGFSCVPSAGGCTLGMGARHVGFKTLTLAEHAAELRRAHRMQLQEINPRGSSSDDSEESEEDYLSEGSGSDLDGETNGFLQPVSPKQRRALLKAAGIRKIDPSEKADCRDIRNSREVCGCSCRDFCDPETCACSQSGIKCQVDRDMFPCGCSRDACGNTIGRVEFNPARVRTHFIHTLMRLEMENRQQQNPYTSVVATASSTNLIPATNQTPSTYYQTHLQTQSNYSSGYASPAYNTASELNHQQTAASSYYHPQTPSTTNTLYGQQQSSLELTHNISSPAAATATSQYAIDSLDSSIFGGSTPATPPSYGELIPIASYHYANAQSQGAPYNSYHNTTIYHNATATTTLNTPPNTYSSCAVPSIPPYGAATTTEAAVIYHSVTSLTALETTTAPSCNISDTTSLEPEVGASFISLSSPMASSSRLSQINDLLQHNRNATTALVAVSSPEEASTSLSLSPCSSQLDETSIYSAATLINTLNTPAIGDEAAHKSCMVYEELAVACPLNTVASEAKETIQSLQSVHPSLTATKTAHISDSSTLNTEFLHTHTPTSCTDDKEEDCVVVITTTSSEVAASN